jgi:hypothetical protein
VVQVDVLVVVTGMFCMPMPIVQIVDVVVVLQRMVSATGAMDMVVIAEVMLPVGSSAGHRSVDLPSRRVWGVQVDGRRGCAAAIAARGPLTVAPGSGHKLEPVRVKNK